MGSRKGWKMQDPEKMIKIMESIHENLLEKSNIHDEKLAKELARKWIRNK